eukprot:COSAG02_NODE_9404_length_2228_cov_1.567872_4_plen_24_part_01
MCIHTGLYFARHYPLQSCIHFGTY